jgi:hypothetical protein
LICGMPMAAVAQESDLSDQLPEGRGKSYVQALCTSCHGLGITVSQRMSLQGWESSVYDMVGRISAGMDQEAEIIAQYLAEHFGLEPVTSHGEAPIQTVKDSPIRVYQQVLFNFTTETTEEQKKVVLESGREVLANISVVMSVLFGRVAPGNSEFQYGFMTGFASEADLQECRAHPEYKRWVQETYRPLISTSSVMDIVAVK